MSAKSAGARGSKLTITLLPRGFYARDTVRVARDLLGKRLVRRAGRTTLSGIITETEAYKHRDDPASHAHNGMTARNRAMFGEVGRAYVYFTYGMHHCVNAVARGRNSMAGAVLIRAIRPSGGIRAMAANRGLDAGDRNLANGPAKLTAAMGIDRNLYGADLTKGGGLFIAEGVDGKIRIRTSTRVGINRAVDKRWNFRVIP